LKRIATVISALVLAITLPSALAGASGRHARLQLRQTKLGVILVNGRGFTLYAFTKDSRNKDVCVTIKGCLGAWPALTSSDRPIAGAGVKARLIGTINVRGVGRQVTYNGFPLYTYVGDSRPGQTYYVNFFQFSGRWPALNAAGQLVK
jgi:predicted lipoprotein with Yx(FWY)xxD motif